MIRMIGWTVVLAGVAAAGFFARPFFDPPSTGGIHPATRHASQPGGPTIEQVLKLANLVTLRVPISDVQSSKLEGFTGSLTVVISVHGEVEIATDLSKARFEDRDEASRSATLILPKPQTVRPRLDHDKTRIVGFQRSGLWWLINGQAGEDVLTDRAMKRAQQVLGQTANQPELIDLACQHTQTVFHEFFGAMGWEMHIQWEAPPTVTAEATDSHTHTP